MRQEREETGVAQVVQDQLAHPDQRVPVESLESLVSTENPDLKERQVFQEGVGSPEVQAPMDQMEPQGFLELMVSPVFLVEMEGLAGVDRAVDLYVIRKISFIVTCLL